MKITLTKAGFIKKVASGKDKEVSFHCGLRIKPLPFLKLTASSGNTH
jgi:hypothetical protein